MWVILCHHEDESALALAALIEREAVDLIVLRPEDLMCATHLHRVGPEVASATALLRDGSTLDLASVSLLVNRFRVVPEAHLRRYAPEDQSYVRAEWTALVASLMSCCGTVLNPPFADAPGGYPLSDIEALHYAAGCSLPISPRVVTDGSECWELGKPAALASHLVVGDAVLPDLPEPLARGSRTLAQVLGLPLLQVDFAIGPDGDPVFHGCSPEVEFRLAPGMDLVAALQRIADGQIAGMGEVP